MAKKTLKERKEAKIGKVLHEYKEGKLKSSSGGKVKNKRQALAIAISESKQIKRKK